MNTIKYAVTSYTKKYGWEVDQDYDCLDQLPAMIKEHEFYELWEEVENGYKTVFRTSSMRLLIKTVTSMNKMVNREPYLTSHVTKIA